MPLGNYFQRIISRLNDKNIKYIWFDFHHECRKMKYENLFKLIDLIKNDLEDIGYFELSYTKEKVRKINYFFCNLFSNLKINSPTIKRLQ